MKKFLAMILCFCLLLFSYSSLSEGSANNDKFVFREKIKWDMKQADVVKLEGQPKNSNTMGVFESISYFGIPVSKYTGTLSYMFYSDKLVLCMYGIATTEESVLEFLNKSLTSVYGECEEIPGKEAWENVRKINPNYIILEDHYNAPAYKWTTAEDTQILLAFDGNFHYLMYLSPTFLSFDNTVNVEEVNTTGL